MSKEKTYLVKNGSLFVGKKYIDVPVTVVFKCTQVEAPESAKHAFCLPLPITVAEIKCNPAILHKQLLKILGIMPWYVRLWQWIKKRLNLLR